MDIINNKDYVDKAETAIKELISDAKRVKFKPRNDNDYEILTTSQLRKQLSMTAELFSQAEQEPADTMSKELLAGIEYLRVQFVYQAGREETVKTFIEKTQILEILKSINGNKEKFLTFCRYMEALVAFRKYYGKKED